LFASFLLFFFFLVCTALTLSSSLTSLHRPILRQCQPLHSTRIPHIYKPRYLYIIQNISIFTRQYPSIPSPITMKFILLSIFAVLAIAAVPIQEATTTKSEVVKTAETDGTLIQKMRNNPVKSAAISALAGAATMGVADAILNNVPRGVFIRYARDIDKLKLEFKEKYMDAIQRTNDETRYLSIPEGSGYRLLLVDSEYSLPKLKAMIADMDNIVAEDIGDNLYKRRHDV
jgi:hypothetical protein